MGIYILFEKENIDTGKMEGELLLSILSSLAESESHSISENEIWSIQKRFRNGTFKISYPPYGYDYIDGKMVVNAEQARMNDMIAFLEEMPAAVTEYSEALARRLVERITIFDEKIVVELKSGLQMEVEE